MSVITQAVVRELLIYDRHTGELKWRRRDESWFKSPRQHKRWNTRYAGKPAFTYQCRGRRWGCILNQNMLAHRIVWLYVTGKLPVALAFKNGKATDLRFANLVEHGSTAAVREWNRQAWPRKRLAKTAGTRLAA